MRSFDEIWSLAVARHGAEALEARLPTVRDPDELATIPDDRALAEITRHVFNAGFRWRVIEAKWDGFEAAFHGFDPARCAAIDAEELAALAQDARIVRNPQKIATVPYNAQLVLDLADEHGSFGAWLAGWPDAELPALLKALGKRGKRLGGDTGVWILRHLGKDTWRLSRDVVARLIAEGVVSRKPTTQAELRAVQDAFMTWKAQSGRPFAEISVVLACSIDAPSA